MKEILEGLLEAEFAMLVFNLKVSKYIRHGACLVDRVEDLRNHVGDWDIRKALYEISPGLKTRLDGLSGYYIDYKVILKEDEGCDHLAHEEKDWIENMGADTPFVYYLSGDGCVCCRCSKLLDISLV